MFLTDALAEAAALRPDHIALDDGQEHWSYAQLHAAAARMARRLVPVGAGPGTVVALIAHPGALTVQAIHAVPRTGAVLAILNPRLTWVELETALDVLQPDVLLTTQASLTRLDADPMWFTVLDDLPKPPADAPEPASEIEDEGPDQHGTTPYMVLWTSGTEGTPRGVVLSRDALRTHAEAVQERLGLSHSDRTLASLSPAHIGGLAMILRAAQTGSTLVVRGAFEAEEFARLIETGEVTHASLVPTMLLRLLDQRGSAPAPETLRCLLIGGAHAPAELIERALSLAYPIALTYGMTEMCSQVATAPPDAVREKPGSVGSPLNGIDVRVREEGELWVRGPTLALGTVSAGAGTVHNPVPLDDLEGGYLTGDLGRVDEDGHLWITGRIASRIISGGVNVDPREVTDLLESLPGVVEAAVVGVPDPEWGERVVAAVVLAPDGSPAGEAALTALHGAARERLSEAKRPREIRVVAALPRNANGKVDPAGVRALFDA